MSPNDNYTYQVFISYSSIDRPWAEKLYQDLTSKGIVVFYDQVRLEAGRPWDIQLLKNLKDSKNIVAIWSENARKSDWVIQEATRFLTINDPNGDSELIANRFIQINLEGYNKAWTNYQSINNLLESKVYEPEEEDKGIGKLRVDLWNHTIEKVVDSIQGADPSIPISLIVLATSRKRLEGLDWNKKPPGGQALIDFIERLGYTEKNAVIQYYGDTWQDWKPFHNEVCIKNIMDETLTRVNELCKDRRYKWVFPGFDFFDLDNLDHDRLSDEIEKIIERFTVVIIDPISLYDDAIKYQYDQMPEFLERSNKLILVLPPFSLSMNIKSVRELIQNRARKIVDNYIDPPTFEGRQYARCCANINDRDEINHWLFTSLADHSSGQKPDRHLYLNQA